MADTPREIRWNAKEFQYYHKTIEWYIVLFVISGALVFSAFFLGNFLLGVLLTIAAIVIAMAAARAPRVVPYSIGVSGVRIGHVFYPHKALMSFSVDEDHRHGPHVYIKPKARFQPLIILMVPSEYVDDIQDILAEKLPVEDIEEPLFNVLLEILRF